MKAKFLLGLTGSIGMGKSTTSAMFAAEGIPVWDADAVVHKLYAKGGAAVAAIGAVHPEAIVDGSVSRPALKAVIAANPAALAGIEAIIHPLVAADRAAVIAASDADLIVLDIPLLFENGTEHTVDATLLVTAPAALQRQRVVARPGMTEAHLAMILARQMPDADKRKRATHIVETLDIASTQAYVRALITYIRGPHA
jgi:dephospho-CoA kinase